MNTSEEILKAIRLAIEHNRKEMDKALNSGGKYSPQYKDYSYFLQLLEE